jgi:hypothetical protein
MKLIATTVAFAFAVALSLGGCTALTNIAGTTVSPQTAIVAANSFDALEAVATGYLQLPKCVATGPVVCRSTAAVAAIIPAVRSGRVARNQIEALLSANSGAAIPVANYNTLQAVITSLQGIYAQYNVKTVN